MDFNNMNDTDLAALQSMQKHVVNQKAKWMDKSNGIQIHQQKNYQVKSAGMKFEVYLRQNTNDSADFSCGISLMKPNGDRLTLSRYNGSAHVHRDIISQCHIHKTIEENLGCRHPEEHAEVTDRYADLAGAVNCLKQDYRIDNMPSEVSGSPKFPLLDKVN